MEKVISGEFNENEKYYYFEPELYTDENRLMLPSKSSGSYSDFKSFLKNNKIPEYAKDYKREYQFIRGINKEFKYIKDFMENFDKEFKSHKLDKIMKFIKRFLRAQENGRLKDISNFEFDYFDIDNIYEIKKDVNYYYSIIQICYDWSRGFNNERLLSLYDIYKNDLELFLSKLNIEIEDTDDSCDTDDDYDIIFSDNDIDSYSDSD